MAVLAFIAIFVFHVPFPYIVLMAGIVGYLGSRVVPEYFQAGGHHGSAKDSYGVALIDDDTPVLEHMRFKWSRVISYVLIGLFIAVLVLGLLANSYGWQGTLTQMGWFFSQSSISHLWWCLCSIALCLSGRC